MINQISKFEGLTPQPKPQAPRQADAAGRVVAETTPARASPTDEQGVRAKAAEAAEMRRAQAESLAQGFNSLVQTMNRELNFQVDDVTGDMVIRVIDAKTDEIVRQIPAEELLALQQRLSEIQESGEQADSSVMDGMLFNVKV